MTEQCCVTGLQVKSKSTELVERTRRTLGPHEVTKSQVQLQQRRCPADVRPLRRNCCNQMRISEFIYKLWASTCLPEGIVLSCSSSGGGGTLQKLCRNACKPTADCCHEGSCTESCTNTTRFGFLNIPWHLLWMSEAPYDAMIAYVWLHACRPSQITHFKSSLESSNSGVKMPYPGSFPKKRVKTQYKMKRNISVAFFLVFFFLCRWVLPRSSLLSSPPSAVVFLDRSSDRPLLQLSRRWT